MRDKNNLRPGVGGLSFASGILMQSGERMAVVMRQTDGTMLTKTGYASGSGYTIDQCALVAETAELAGCRIAVLAMETLMFLMPCVVLFSPLPDLSLWLSPLETVARIGLGLLYYWAVTRTGIGTRLRMYHGAEHKAVNCYYSGRPLTIEYARRQSRRSVSCGSNSTVILLALMALFASMVRPLPLRLLAFPVLVAASKWIWRYAQRHNFGLARHIVAAGMALQRITTTEPTDEMLEVALMALKLVTPKPPAAQRRRVRKRRAS